MTSHNKHHGGLHVVLGERYKNTHNFIKRIKYVWNNFIWALNVIIYQPKHTFALHFLFVCGKRSATVRACPQILYYLGLAIVFIDEDNPSKIFKMASNSVQVTDVSF